MTEYIKEMVYFANAKTPQRIAEGTHKNLKYYVLNFGTHPCAYVDVTDTELRCMDYSSIEIECHGGLTYSRDTLHTVDKTGWFIGWDYAHYGDFAGYEMLYSQFESSGKHWTTQEIVNECEAVIDRIIELIKVKGEMKRRPNISYTDGNKDDVKSAVDGLAIFCHSWCMNCEETERTDEPVFRCKECPFSCKETHTCLVKVFVNKHGTEKQKDSAFAMS